MLGIFAVAAVAIIVLFHIRRLRRSQRLDNGMSGGILDVDNFQGVGPIIVQQSHHRSPPDANNSYSASSGALIDYGRPQPDRGSMGEAPAMRQTEISKRFSSTQQTQLAAAQGVQPVDDRSPPARSLQEMASLRNQVEELRNRVDHLQGQQQPDRALDPSEEQPPAYE